MNKDVVIIGAGGHAKVIADIIWKSGDNLIGFLDDNIEINTSIIKNVKVIGSVTHCIELQEKNSALQFIIGIGNNYIRKEIYEQYSQLNFYTAIHPNSTISTEVLIGKGTVIMANACINICTTIGKCCIINTNAVVEHDNVIHNFVHISPTATLCGTVTIGECTHIGAGVTIKNNMTITDNCIIGLGAVVVKSIEERGTYIGVPSRRLEK